MQSMTSPILDVCWSDNGTKVFIASCDQQVQFWDLGSYQTIQVAAHDAPMKTCHWVKAPSYTCIMTGSWDKTLKVCFIDFYISSFCIYMCDEVICDLSNTCAYPLTTVVK